MNARKELIELESTDYAGSFLSNLGDFNASDTLSTLDATANISEFGKQIKVRMNFQRKVLNNDLQPLDITQINDPKFYQEFFVKVDKGLFLEKEGL